MNHILKKKKKRGRQVSRIEAKDKSCAREKFMKRLKVKEEMYFIFQWEFWSWSFVSTVQ